MPKVQLPLRALVVDWVKILCCRLFSSPFSLSTIPSKTVVPTGVSPALASSNVYFADLPRSPIATVEGFLLMMVSYWRVSYARLSADTKWNRSTSFLPSASGTTPPVGLRPSPATKARRSAALLSVAFVTTTLATQCKILQDMLLLSPSLGRCTTVAMIPVIAQSPTSGSVDASQGSSLALSGVASTASQRR